MKKNLNQLGGLHFPYEKSCIIADIPGLIEGASEGVGLGHAFLRHIERTKILLHVVDASHENTVPDYKTINSELERYKEELLQRTQLVVLNKADITDARRLSSLKKYFRSQGLRVLEISALKETNIVQLKEIIGELLHRDAR